MPDERKHRGPHPEDRQLFAADQVPRLSAATSDLSWLLTKEYASPSALKIVGDRYQLDARQRLAVARCACSDQARNLRHQQQVEIVDVKNQELWIDGYNVLISLEAALAGGVILHARDGCYRDMASMHGSYRNVEETMPAIMLLGDSLAAWGVASCRWFFDQPVSNSGRLKQRLQEIAEQMQWNWQIDLVPDPDYVLSRTDRIVASSDSQIINATPRRLNLARTIIDLLQPSAWIVDLSCGQTRG